MPLLNRQTPSLCYVVLPYRIEQVQCGLAASQFLVKIWKTVERKAQILSFFWRPQEGRLMMICRACGVSEVCMYLQTSPTKLPTTSLPIIAMAYQALSPLRKFAYGRTGLKEIDGLCYPGNLKNQSIRQQMPHGSKCKVVQSTSISSRRSRLLTWGWHVQLAHGCKVKKVTQNPWSPSPIGWLWVHVPYHEPKLIFKFVGPKKLKRHPVSQLAIALPWLARQGRNNL